MSIFIPDRLQAVKHKIAASGLPPHIITLLQSIIPPALDDDGLVAALISIIDGPHGFTPDELVRLQPPQEWYAAGGIYAMIQARVPLVADTTQPPAAPPADLCRQDVDQAVAARRQDITSKAGREDLALKVADICQRHEQDPASHLARHRLRLPEPPSTKKPAQDKPKKPARKPGQEVMYMPSLFVRCAFPAQEPDGPVWSRQDGDWLLMLSGGSRKNPTTGKAELSGLPYGKLPRLILLEIATQVVRTGRREVRLGDTMSAIVRQLGLKKGGGSKGPNARLRDQLDRVFRAQITLERTVKVGDNRERQEWQNRRMVKSAGLLWQLDSPGEPLGEDSHIVLDDDFYREILRHSVPVDGGAARSLIHGARGSCLAYDLYLWLAARVARGGQNPRTLIRYSEMRNHLGLAGYEGQAGADNFRRKMREALTAVLAVWPEAAAGSWFTAEKDGLVLNLPAAQPPVVVQPAKARVIELDVAPALVETLDGAAPRQRVQAPAD